MAKRYEQYCPMAHALDLVGDRWALLVVRELMHGPKRYTDLVDRLHGIGTNILATRLRDLEAHGVVVATYPPTARGVEGLRADRLRARAAPGDARAGALGRPLPRPARGGHGGALRRLAGQRDGHRHRPPRPARSLRVPRGQRDRLARRQGGSATARSTTPTSWSTGDPDGIYSLFVDRCFDLVTVDGDRALLERLLEVAPATDRGADHGRRRRRRVEGPNLAVRLKRETSMASTPSNSRRTDEPLSKLLSPGHRDVERGRSGFPKRPLTCGYSVGLTVCWFRTSATHVSRHTATRCLRSSATAASALDARPCRRPAWSSPPSFVEHQTPAEVAARYGVSPVLGLQAQGPLRGRGRGRVRAPVPATARPHPARPPPDVVDLILRLRKELTDAGLDAGPDTIAWHLEPPPPGHRCPGPPSAGT